MTENIASSYKDSNKFFRAIDIIAATLLQYFRNVTVLQVDFAKCFNAKRLIKVNLLAGGSKVYTASLSCFKAKRALLQADFVSLDCMVRDQRKTNSSTSSGSAISNAIAILFQAILPAISSFVYHRKASLITPDSVCLVVKHSRSKSAKSSSVKFTFFLCTAHFLRGTFVRVLQQFKGGLNFSINAYSISAIIELSPFASSQATVRSSSPSSSFNLWCCFQRLLKSLLRPIYKSVSSFESTKYIAAVLGNALRQLRGSEGSDRTSISSKPFIFASHCWVKVSGVLSHNCLAKYLTKSEVVIPRFSASSCSFCFSNSLTLILNSSCLDICRSVLYNDYKSIVATFVAIANTQITKHLRKQVLVANRYSRKDGRLRKKTYDEYNRERGRSPCPDFTMPISADVGGGMTERSSLADVPHGKEGYIYLIHAEGTNRYKIGRSVNPIARVSDIQKQSPYKLKIVRSAWTLDAPFDEAELHRRYSDWRVFGEWFELDQLLEGAEGTDKYPKTRLQAVDHELIYLLPTMQNVAIHPIKTLSEFLNCDLFESDITVRIGFDIQRLYKQIRNRAQIVLAQEFLTCLLPLIVLETYNINHDTFLMTLADDRAKEFGFESRLISFMSGAIASFKALTLNKRGMA